MRPAHVVHIETPTGVHLNGLWFGPSRPEQAVVLVHGLMSSAFSMRRALELVDKKTAVLTFNNRGHGLMNFVTKNIKKSKKQKWILAGCAHEVFRDCVDDIDGALNFVRGQGVKEIFLAGHSTGCQKSIYFASKGNIQNVKGIMILAPISDYASYMHLDNKNRSYKKALATARALVKAGKPHAMIPDNLSGEFKCDAQRFISLYTPDSPEEIFCYATPKLLPKTLIKVQLPVLAVLAENDEYSDRSAEDLAAWFTKFIYTGEVSIIPESDHGFTDKEQPLKRVMAAFMKKRYN